MKRKGFTLVELLGVIVVLAIIALITTPVVLGVIESTRKGAFVDSVYGLIETTNIYYTKNMQDIAGEKRFTCNGTVCTNGNDTLSFKGKVPIGGSITLKENAAILVEYITDGTYCAYGTLNDLIVDKGCANIDVTPAILDETKVTLKSTTNSITVTLVEGYARDDESGIKEYRITVNGETKTLKEVGTVTFEKLKQNHNYEVKIEVENGKGLTAKMILNQKTLEFSNPTIILENNPKSPINGYLKSQVAKVTYDKTNIEKPSYYIKTTREGISNIAITKSCGNDTMPSLCTNISSITTLKANTWYQIDENITITYNQAVAKNDTIYAYTSDSVNYSGASTATLSKIDTTAPTLTLGASVSKTNNIIIPIVAKDEETGITTPVCKYGTTEGNYTETSTNVSTTGCSLKNLKANTTYYYQVCVSNPLRMNTCKTGTAETKIVSNPTITLENNPATPINGYLKSQVAKVTYNGTDISEPHYYVKTTRVGISNVAVTKSCGTGTIPSTCTDITSTTTLKANTWYEVTGNINVTYNQYSDKTDTIYAIAYDGTNYSGASTATISKITKTVNYKVNHYQMNVTGTGYTLKETETLSGSAGYPITPNTKSYAGFTSPTKQTVTVASDGSTIINYNYTRNQYTIMVNKGTGIASVSGAGTYYYGATVNLGYSLIAGYHFSSWTGTYSISSFTMPAGNVTMTANGAGNVYYIAYNGNGADSGSMGTTTCTYGQNCTLAGLGYGKTGHHFNNWSGSNGGSYSNGQTVSNLTTTNGATITMYVNWGANVYYITYNGNGATSGSMGTTTCTYGQNCTLAGLGYGKTGHSFSRWSGSNGGSYSNGQIVSNLTTTNGATITMNAVWKVNQYTVTVNRGTGIAGVSGGGTYNYGATVNLGYSLTAGYHFTSWSGSYGTGSFTMPANNVTMTANGAGNTYYIVYNGNGSNGGSMSNTTCTYGSNCTLRANSFSKTGYSFNGWSGSNGGSYSNGQTVSNLTATNGGSITLTAKWKANTYTVKFNGNGGNSASSIKVTYNSTYGTLPTTTRSNGTMSDLNVNTTTVTGLAGTAIKYKFLGWYTAASGGTKITSSSKVSITDTQTLYAHWGAYSPSGTFWFGNKDLKAKKSSTVTVNSYGYSKVKLTLNNTSSDTVTLYVNGTAVKNNSTTSFTGNTVKLKATSNGTNAKSVKWTLSN